MRTFLLLMPILLLSGCVHASPRSEQQPVAIDENSNVCISVSVEEAIWPPVDGRPQEALGGILLVELYRRYKAEGGSGTIEGRSGDNRFKRNFDGTNQSCQDIDTDVLIELAYRQRSDGAPFLLDYAVSRGTVRREGSIDVDVAEEIRSGRMKGYNQRRNAKSIIYEDVVGRAPMIYSLLERRPPST